MAQPEPLHTLAELLEVEGHMATEAVILLGLLDAEGTPVMRTYVLGDARRTELVGMLAFAQHQLLTDGYDE
jgi:hypothetical protein